MRSLRWFGALAVVGAFAATACGDSSGPAVGPVVLLTDGAYVDYNPISAGAEASVEYRRLSAPLINNEALSALMHDVAADLIGAGNVRQGVRTMGGEDMAFFLASVPGCFAFVGSAPKGGRASPHHSPTFDIDEESLVIGAELLTQTAIRYLD